MNEADISDNKDYNDAIRIPNQSKGGQTMENQTELQLGIGTEEAITLKPAKVKVLSIEIKVVGTKNAKKVILTVQHPDAKEPIHISEVKYESKGKLETSGLWVNLDSQKMIRKGSALAVFLQSLGCSTIEQLKDKEADTAQGDKGYLCFKAY